MNELEPKKQQLPEKEPAQVEVWKAKEDGLHFEQTDIHLGRNPEGGFTDEVSTIVDKAGLRIEVGQNSAGLTRLVVEPLDGYEAKVLTVDTETQLPIWKGASEYSKEIVISDDYGELVKDNSEAATKPWTSGTRFGVEGIHAGIVRVTNQNSEVKYFGLGAVFKGDADDWTVTAEGAEVFPSNALETPHQQIES